jgi:hypothetical protein
MSTNYLIIDAGKNYCKGMRKRAKKKRDKVITSAQKNYYCNNQIVFTS